MPGTRQTEFAQCDLWVAYRMADFSMSRIHPVQGYTRYKEPQKKGSPKAPRSSRRSRQFLEDELRRDGDAARIAGEHLRRLVEHRLGWNREVVHRGAGESDGSHVADVAANVLRVVEDVEEASGELDLILFGERHALGNRGIDVVGRIHALRDRKSTRLN